MPTIQKQKRSAAGPDGAFCAKSVLVKAIDAGKRTADFVASTDVVDAHSEIVDQSTWHLEDYLKNPVVLYAHECDDLPIGRCVDIGVRNNQLECRIEFATEDMNPLAEQVWKMVQAKFLRAVSVGFCPSNGRYEMRDGEDVWVWSDCTLKEISVTPVPANPEALAKKLSLAQRAATTTPPALPGPQPSNDEKEPIMATETKDVETISKQAAQIAEMSVTTKAMTERAEKAEKALADADARAKALETERTALETQNKALAEQRDKAVARAEKAEAVAIDQEVEALVGKKITAGEKPLFVDLRKSNPDLFAKMVEQRAPMKLDETIIAGKGEENGVAKSLVASAGEDILSEIEKLGDA